MPSGRSSDKSVILPAAHERIKRDILAATDKFLEDHKLRLKIRKLPLPSDELQMQEGASSSSTSSEIPGAQLPLYHFVTRQKRHMTEQLLRNRSGYRTEYNISTDERNRFTPFQLREMPDTVLEHLRRMASDFDDPEFSGVWLSLHTQPFMTDSEFGNLARSKIVGWALIEVLTTNERCLKALWVHPKLSSRATLDLLKGFLPRVVLEAFDLVAPLDEETCPWKFFYTWLNDFDMLPRPTWLMLTSPKVFGLPKHCDNLMENDEAAGHVDDGNPEGSDCPCRLEATWDNWDEILVGCTEAFMYRNWDLLWKNVIPVEPSIRLLEDSKVLPHDNCEDMMVKETREEVEKAEMCSMSKEQIAKLVHDVWGKWAKGRMVGIESILLNLGEAGGNTQTDGVVATKTEKSAVKVKKPGKGIRTPI